MNKKLLSYTASLAIIALGAALFFKQDTIFDIWRLRNYQAPSEIVRLADVTKMTDPARRLFYVYHPSLEDKASFNGHCTNAEQTIVLGCYIEFQGIYLYRVTDERLNGVVEVTAAHEMLHAAYDRLSAKERSKIDALTSDVASGISDERLKTTIENYRKKDPSVVPNELHSILATEVRDLPPELEKYYSQYFSDRSAIVGLAERYQSEFTARDRQVEAYDAELASLKAEIDAIDQQLQVQQANLKTQSDDLQQKRRDDTDAYNAAVPQYNQAVNEFNSGVNRQKQLVIRYNTTVELRNEIATEENELSQAIDSRQTIDSQ